jgi:hypothetical protein
MHNLPLLSEALDRHNIHNGQEWSALTNGAVSASPATAFLNKFNWLHSGCQTTKPNQMQFYRSSLEPLIGALDLRLGDVIDGDDLIEAVLQNPALNRARHTRSLSQLLCDKCFTIVPPATKPEDDCPNCGEPNSLHQKFEVEETFEVISTSVKITPVE